LKPLGQLSPNWFMKHALGSYANHQKDLTMLGDNFIPNIEEQTGLTTKQFVLLAIKKGLGDPAIKPGVRMAWLKEEYGLGHGHAMAMAHAIKTALLKARGK
jgi:hypothetical protein